MVLRVLINIVGNNDNPTKLVLQQLVADWWIVRGCIGANAGENIGAGNATLSTLDNLS